MRILLTSEFQKTTFAFRATEEPRKSIVISYCKILGIKNSIEEDVSIPLRCSRHEKTLDHKNPDNPLIQ